MASSFTTNKQIEKPGHNDYVDDWDVPVNANMDIIDNCLGKVTSINMTSLSSYTLTYADIQAATLKFTNTLNNATVPIRMPNGVSGIFTIINATSAAGTSSALSLTWGSNGNSFVVGQGQTRILYANGSASPQVWAPSAPISQVVPSSISLTGVVADIALTQQQCSGGHITFSGTLLNGLLSVYPTADFFGTLVVRTSYGAAGGSSQLAMFSPGGGGSGFIMPNNKLLLVGFATSEAWLLGNGTQP